MEEYEKLVSKKLVKDTAEEVYRMEGHQTHQPKVEDKESKLNEIMERYQKVKEEMMEMDEADLKCGGVLTVKEKAEYEKYKREQQLEYERDRE